MTFIEEETERKLIYPDCLVLHSYSWLVVTKERKDIFYCTVGSVCGSMSPLQI